MRDEELEMQNPEIADLPEQEELDIYTKEGIEGFVDDDSISPSEQGFMMGYLGA
jgi:hypothetical protein